MLDVTVADSLCTSRCMECAVLCVPACDTGSLVLYSRTRTTGCSMVCESALVSSRSFAVLTVGSDGDAYLPLDTGPATITCPATVQVECGASTTVDINPSTFLNSCTVSPTGATLTLATTSLPCKGGPYYVGVTVSAPNYQTTGNSIIVNTKGGGLQSST